MSYSMVEFAAGWNLAREVMELVGIQAAKSILLVFVAKDDITSGVKECIETALMGDEIPMSAEKLRFC